MTFETISGHWQDAFERLVGSIREYGLFVSPFITSAPIECMVQILQKNGVASEVRLEVLTNLSVDNILRGSTDPASFISLMEAIPYTRVMHLPTLHAKVYVADESEAIITSANLTESGLMVNYEYGVRTTDREFVRRVRKELQEYSRLGNVVPRPDIEQFAQTANELKSLRHRIEHEAKKTLREEFQRRVGEAEIELMAIRASGKSTNGIFADTILYLLRRYGPMSTTQLHPLIQQIHPDLCDDSIDRVIKGVHFGKKWKHYVRNAQQFLKQRGQIDFDGKYWYLT